MERSFSEPRRKAVPPEETIRRIRGILSDCDLFVVETTFPAQNGTYSCRLELGDPPLFGWGFGVNGKGMSPRYALASAYGELMEDVWRLAGRFQALGLEARVIDAPQLATRIVALCRSRALLPRPAALFWDLLAQWQTDAPVTRKSEP